MTLWRFEARKMFKMNRGSFIVALFLVVELAVLILGDAPVNADAALYREQYLAELEKVEGPWTSEKAALLEKEARDTARSGEGFDVLYKQYLYVNGGRENRYFLDVNGWAGLLADRALDLPLVAAIILLTVPIYCGEAVSGMEPLTLASREGKRLFTRHKLLLALTVTAALSLSSDLVRLAFFALKYGLPHGGYPMQSIEGLGTAVKSMSLWAAEALAVGLRLLGSVELALMTLLFSALCGKFAMSAFLAAAVSVLPWIGLDRSLQFSLPLPSSLLLAVGFIEGSEFDIDPMTGDSAAVFSEVRWTGLALTVTGAVLICAVCALFIRRRYKTALTGGRKFNLGSAALCLALCLTLGGCGKDVPAPRAGTVYNSRGTQIHEYNGLTVSVKSRGLTVTDSSGNSAPLVRDALRPLSGAAYAANFYASGRYVYFWKKESEGYGQKLASDTGRTYITTLVRVDLDTFDSEAVFENVVQHTVLGIDVPTDGSLDFLGGDGDFFVDEKYVYILGSGTRRVERRTGKLSVLDIPANRNVAFDGRYIYFISSAGILSRFDTETENTVTLYAVPVADFRLAEDGLTVTSASGEALLPIPE